MRKKIALILIILPLSLFAGIVINEVLNVSRYLREVTDTIVVDSIQFTKAVPQGEWEYLIRISLYNPTYRRILVSVDDPFLKGGDLFYEPIMLFTGKTYYLEPGDSYTVQGTVHVGESLFRELRLAKTSEFYVTCGISVSSGSIFKARKHIDLLHSQYNFYY